MGNCREVVIHGRTLLVHELDDVVDPRDGTALSGAWLWDCALVLAKWFDTAPWRPEGGLLAGKRVVELGAGLGLPGMAAARLGARVILTDREPLIAGLQRNIAANGLEEYASADVLEWGKSTDHLKVEGSVDIILGSDLLYDVSATPILADTLLSLSTQETQIFIAYELREKSVECFRLLRERGFRWSKLPIEEMHPDWQSDDIGIFRFYRPTLSPLAEISDGQKVEPWPSEV